MRRLFCWKGSCQESNTLTTDCSVTKPSLNGSHIEKLLTLRVDAATSCAEMHHQAEAKLVEVEQKLQALQQIQLALIDLVAACAQGGPQGECPILEVLEERARQPKKHLLQTANTGGKPDVL